MGLQIFLIAFFIVLNGIFAASEIALVSASKRELEEDTLLGGKKAKKAQRVLKLVEEPTRFLSTIQIGITMFGFINGAIAADAFSKMFSDTIANIIRSEEHTSELQSRPHLVCRLLLEKKNNNKI